jgi:hypothetical protein
VLGVRGGGVHAAPRVYDAAHIAERSRLIGLAIDARRQRYPDETPYVYKPFLETGESHAWTPGALDSLKDYNLLDMSI